MVVLLNSLRGELSNLEDGIGTSKTFERAEEFIKQIEQLQPFLVNPISWESPFQET